MNKQTLTYELKIKAIIDSAQKDLAGFGQAMGQAWANGEPPKSLLKAMESMRQRLGSLSEIAQKGVVDSSDLAQAEDDYKAFTKTLHSLTVEFGLFTAEQKKAMLSPEEQKAMQGRVEALKKYNEELKRSNEISEKRKPLEEQQKTQSTKVKNLTKKKEDDESAYKALKEQGGPKFSKESQVYIDNQKRILELNEKIRIAQEKVNKGETLGKIGEGKNNEWTRAAESLERYQRELAEIDSEAGKAFYDKELKDYNESLNELEKNIGFTSTALDEAKKELSGTEEQLKKLKASDPKELFNDLVKQLKDLGVEGIDGVTTFEALEKAVTKLNSKALAKVDDALATAKQELLKMGQAAKEAKKGIDESTAAIKQQEAAIAEREAFEGKIKQFLGLAGAVEVMKNAFRNAFATIKELDATMGEMAVVTDLTVGDYWDQLPEYSKRASELGVSINSAYEAATLYYQQGLKTNEVISISTETLKMARIAGLSAEDATQKMTAALRGFNMELNETSAQRISDVYSELAAITAADVEQISNAMSKTASIASSAGMEFETTAAFLSQIIETTQESAETAGTALKTVIARFQELKKDPAEIGEVDGEIVDANAIETALRSVGVSLRDANGQFRDLDDVFLELASKWKTLDKNTQRYIATIAAGSRQQSRFLAMMSDYERTQELVTAANNSAGAGNKQFEKTMDTLKAKLEKLKNAWDEFAMGILNSDLVKVGVDILTKFLEIINKATSSFNGLGGSIVKIFSVITMFKLGQKIFDKFKQPLFKFFSDLTKMGYQAGYDAGKAYAEGVATAKQEASTSKTVEDLQSQSKDIIASNQKQGLGRKLWEKTGLPTIGRAGKDLQDKDKKALVEEWESMIYDTDKPISPFGRTKAIDIAKQKRIKAVQDAEAEYNKNKNTLEGLKKGKSKKDIKKSSEVSAAQKAVNASETNLTNARKELVKFDETQKQVQKNGQEGWEKMGQGISQLGGNVMAVGVAVSALGGIFDALGMEEVGEVFAQVGSIMTLLGGAISAIGTLVPIVTKILVASGYSVQSAWWPLLVIGLAIAAIVGIVAGITAAVKAAEAAKYENRLKAAREYAEELSNAADEAAKNCDKLNKSLQELGNKYKSLKGLAEGTKEWKQAVQDTNKAVLELINDYPELATLVSNENGVLKLDLEDERVQEVINKAETQKTDAQNASFIAKTEEQQIVVQEQYVQLDATKEISKMRGRSLNLDQEFKESLTELSQALVEGQVNTNLESMYNYLIKEQNMAAEEALLLAKELSKDREALLKYTNSVNSLEAQQTSAFQAIATSAHSLADTMELTSEQIKQSRNLVDNDTTESLYKSKMETLDLYNFRELKHLDPTVRKELQETIESVYGEYATIDNKGVVKYQKDGADATVTLTPAQMKSLIATKYSREQATVAVEKSGLALETLGQVFGNEVVDALYRETDGKGLTQADAKALEEKLGEDFIESWQRLSDTEKEAYKTDTSNLPAIVKETWGKLSSEERLTFGNDITNLVDDLANGVYIANTAFRKAGEAARDFMTREQAANFSTKLSEVASLSGGEGAKKSIITATDQLLLGKSDEEKREIQERINETDWSSLEDLATLQATLVYEYGYTEEAASSLVKTIGDGAFAISTLNTTVLAMNEVWKSSERIAQSLEKVADLQWQYNRALEAGEIQASQDLLQQILEEYEYEAQQYSDAYEANKDNIARVYAQGYDKNGINWTDYIKLGAYGVDYENSDIESLVARGAKREDIQNWIEEINKNYQNSKNQIKGLQKTLESIENLEQQGENAYLELRDMVKETLLNKLQEQIELQQNAIDVSKESNDNLINQLRQQVNRDRQDRDNLKAEQDIADLNSQKLYLTASGGSAAEIAALDKQIAESSQNYQDSLIDQAISNLQDANDKAYEQRERQINLAEMQLEAYQNSKEFQSEIDRQVQTLIEAKDDWTATAIGQEMKDQLKGMSSAEVDNWTKNLQTLITTSNSWQTTDWNAQKDSVNMELDVITAGLTSISQQISGLAEGKYYENTVTKLRGAGFSSNKLEKLNTEQLAKVQQFQAREGTSESITSKYNAATTLGLGAKTKTQYYNDLLDTVYHSNGSFDITKAKTYSQYLDGIVGSDKAKEKREKRAWLMDKYIKENPGISIEKIKEKEIYSTELENWISGGGTEKEFDEYIMSHSRSRVPTDALTGNYALGKAPELKVKEELADGIYRKEGKVNIRGGEYEFYYTKMNPVDEGMYDYRGSREHGLVSFTPGFGAVVYDDGHWYMIANWPNGAPDVAALHKEKPFTFQYKNGGLADFTGPAWLDGTKAHPEMVLNARDTQNFIQLKDILAEILDGTNHTTNNSQNKQNTVNTIDIDINVESIGDDYDVEQLADKIRSMLYDDATYRNVNTISLSH